MTPLSPSLRFALVLGAAVWRGGAPSPTLARRTEHAISLFKAGNVDRIIGCGGHGRHAPSEAEVIARLCTAAGVPRAALLVEDQSRTTRENLCNAKILLPLGAQVVIVTDPYHQPRARLIAWQIGLKANSSSPAYGDIGPRQWLRNVPREGLALIATALRLR